MRRWGMELPLPHLLKFDREADLLSLFRHDHVNPM